MVCCDINLFDKDLLPELSIAGNSGVIAVWQSIAQGGSDGEAIALHFLMVSDCGHYSSYRSCYTMRAENPRISPCCFPSVFWGFFICDFTFISCEVF